MSFNLFLDSSKAIGQPSHDFTIKFNNAIPLDGKYEVAMIGLNMWYSNFNVSAALGNNVFRYSTNAGVSWNNITLPNGNYGVQDINKEVQRQLALAGHWDTVNQVHYLALVPNTSTLRVRLDILNPTYQVDFTNLGLRELLGFNSAIYTATIESPNLVDITRGINSFYLRTNLITGSYDNSALSDVIYSFVPRVRSGANIFVEPTQLIYFPANVFSHITDARVYLTDQLGRAIDLNGEPLTLRLHVRKIQ